ncbi:MAG: sigma-54 dependent transcriptional regulator [Bermanella sp.]
MKPTLVIVDDDKTLLESLKESLKTLNAFTKCFKSPKDALLYCQNKPVEMVICNVRKPALAGLELLEEIKNKQPNCYCLLLSSPGFEENVQRESLKNIDCSISTPWSTDEVHFHVKQILDKLSLQPLKNEFSFHSIISNSQNMYDIFKCIRRLATNNVPIFICGETGTGKELIAKACHDESSRSEQPFVAVNCANFTESLMETQLFGHKKGAFTGAINDQAGLFSSARSGTLFLDEVTTIPINLQAKLLRVIQERVFNPLGSHHSEKFHAQIITASSKTLKSAVDDGEFREDLFYRLNVIYLHLPPLRDRDGDVKRIAQYYLTKFSEEGKKQFNILSDSHIKLLENYDWPGNIRQLENFIHSLVILNDGPDISEVMIKEAFRLIEGGPDKIPLNKKALSSHERLRHDESQYQAPQTKQHNHFNYYHEENLTVKPLWLIEKEHIEKTIELCQGNIYKAAALLEISPSTIYRKQQSWK